MSLLGDSGYPLRPGLSTPIQNPQNADEEECSRRHASARATVERCNGLLKMRLRCLLKHRVLHYSPQAVSKIINACMVVHNICIANNVQLFEHEDNAIDVGVIKVEAINEANARCINPDLLADVFKAE